jgi:hypothetical protein
MRMPTDPPEAPIAPPMAPPMAREVGGDLLPYEVEQFAHVVGEAAPVGLGEHQRDEVRLRILGALVEAEPVEAARRVVHLDVAVVEAADLEPADLQGVAALVHAGPGEMDLVGSPFGRLVQALHPVDPQFQLVQGGRYGGRAPRGRLLGEEGSRRLPEFVGRERQPLGKAEALDLCVHRGGRAQVDAGQVTEAPGPYGTGLDVGEDRGRRLLPPFVGETVEAPRDEVLGGRPVRGEWVLGGFRVVGGDLVGGEREFLDDALGDGPHLGMRDVGHHSMGVLRSMSVLRSMGVLRHFCSSPVGHRSLRDCFREGPTDGTDRGSAGAPGCAPGKSPGCASGSGSGLRPPAPRPAAP